MSDSPPPAQGQTYQAMFLEALHEALGRADHDFVSWKPGRTRHGILFHEVTALSEAEESVTFRILCPPTWSSWDTRLAERAEDMFRYGYLHFCSETATCKGGRNDTGKWEEVNCPDCLESRPFPSMAEISFDTMPFPSMPMAAIIEEGSKSMGEVWAGVAEHAALVSKTCRDTWYGYECFNGDCRSKKVGSQTGCVLDVRFPLNEDEPMIPCPFCLTPMEFKGRWKATESGHGSRGDGAAR